jgi:protein-tyrosine phosphatase
MTDPTAINLDAVSSDDPTVARIIGFTAHGDNFIDTPFITPIASNLWHGGTKSGLVLPQFIKHDFSLYQWGEYIVNHELISSHVMEMYDSVDQSLDEVEQIADWVNVARSSGPVLVRCQAGLNRSSLVVAAALVRAGDVANGREAVELMREKRSPAVLCNPSFEKWVLAL